MIGVRAGAHHNVPGLETKAEGQFTLEKDGRRVYYSLTATLKLLPFPS